LKLLKFFTGELPKIMLETAGVKELPKKAVDVQKHYSKLTGKN
jgi:hypothetical protein